MLPVLGATLIWIPALLGWGLVLDRRTSGQPDGITLLLGLAVVSVVSLTWTLVLPAGRWLSVGTMLGGWVLLLKALHRGLSFDRRAVYVAVAAAAFNGVMSAAASRYADMGLYYLQATAWLAQNGSVRGLAHLQPQLAFSRPAFAAAAALELPGAAHAGGYVLSGVGFIAACLLPLRGWQLLNQEPRVGAALLLASAAACGAFVESAGTHSPDLLIAVLAFGTFSAFLMALDGGADDRHWAGVTAVLGALAASIKINAAFLVAPTAWLAVRHFPRRRGAGLAVAPACVGVLVCLLSAIHQWLASGCFVYPVVWTCTDVPWGSRASATALYRLVVAWNRLSSMPTDEVLGMGWGWVGPWFTSWHVYPFVVVCVTYLAGSARLAWRVRQQAARWAQGVWVVAWTCIAGIAVWFATAPAVRFSYGYTIPLTVLPISVVVAVSAGRAEKRGKYRALVAIAGLSVAMAGWGLRTTLSFRRKPPTVAVFGWPVLPKADLQRVRTAGGAEANMARPGQLCWDAPIPCVPGPLDPRLRWSEGQYRVERGERPTD